MSLNARRFFSALRADLYFKSKLVECVSLTSYGRGRELPGKRHRSLLYGQILTDVVIKGENGTTDGQGSKWWDWFRNGELNYTRPHLVELMNSTGLIISNLTFLNLPFRNFFFFFFFFFFWNNLFGTFILFIACQMLL
ncbi:unnamed protein product [Brassica oleracea]